MNKRIWAALLLVLALLAGLTAWAAADTLPRAISLASTQKVLGLGRGANTANNIARVEAAFKPKGAQAVYRVESSNESAVQALQDSRGWYLRAVGAGRSVVSAIVQRQVDGAWVDTNIRHRITVQVKDSVRLSTLASSTKKLALTVGEGFDLAGIALRYKPLYADCVKDDGAIALNWSSSKTAVARVEDGRVIAQGKGSCKLVGRAPDGSGKKVTITLTVREVRPSALALSETSAILKAGETLSLGYTLSPANASNPLVTWSSSAPGVAAVDDRGNVTAHKAGSARITCRAAANTKVSASCLIKVEDGPTQGTVYRLYTVGNAVYDGYDDLPAALADQKLIAGAFAYAREAGMQAAPSVNRQNLTGDQLKAFMNAMAESGADEDDVTVFFYSGHGYDKTGALVGSDRARVEVSQVRAYLDRVPGTVILMLDSCFSGQYATGKSAVAPEDFNRKVIDAFAGGATVKAADGGKYKVLTACAADQESWCGSFYSFFSYLAAQGLGCQWPQYTQGKLLADENGNQAVTLDELYRYAQAGLPAILKKYSVQVPQDVQLWPAADQTVLLSRR